MGEMGGRAGRVEQAGRAEVGVVGHLGHFCVLERRRRGGRGGGRRGGRCQVRQEHDGEEDVWCRSGLTSSSAPSRNLMTVVVRNFIFTELCRVGGA